MEPKTIVAIVLVAFIIGGFIFLQIIALLTKAVTPLQQVYNRHRR